MAAPQREDYTNYETVDVDDFGDGRHLGVLQMDAPASGFRYEKDVFFIVPFSALPGNGLLKNIVAEWTIQLRPDATPTAPVLFEQTVKLPVQFIGLLGFAFWSPLSEQISVETTVVNGQAVPVGRFPGSTDPSDPQTHHQGWQFVDVLSGSPTEYAEQGLPDFDFSDTSSFNSLGALVNIRYYSAAYKQDIPPAAIFDAVRDTAGVGMLDKEATYQVSFKSSPGIGHWFDSNSLTHMALSGSVGGNSGVVIWERPQRNGRGAAMPPLRQRAFLPGLSTPQLCKTGDGVLWMLAQDAGRASQLWRSRDDGLRFERVTLNNNGSEVDYIVFGTGYTLLDIKPGANGSYQLAAKDGTLYLQKFPQPFAQNRTVGAARSGRVYRLDVQPGKAGQGTIRVESHDHAFVSSDEFLTKVEQEG